MRLTTFKISAFAVLILVLLPAISIAAPQLLFSDLESGPKTGWEGSATKGAAVTVWGKGFGSTRGTSYVTINGAQLSAASDYAEWGAVGPARGLERITFWLNSNATDGSGSITVTVNGETSNALPFTVRSGNIYFISQSDGSNSYTGGKASYQGGNAGPWKNFYMIDPGNNGSVTPGDVIYVRNGVYSTLDEQDFIVLYRGDGGVAGRPVATVGYPAEWPQIGTASVPSTHCAISVETNAVTGGIVDYTEWHKMLWKSGHCAISTYGSNGIRMVGNRFEESQQDAWTGVVYADNARNHDILGNYFYRNGFDKFKHDLYYNTKNQYYGSTRPDTYNVNLAWNEFRETWTDPSIAGIERGGPSVEFKSQSPSDTGRVYNIHINNNLWKDNDDSALYFSERFENIHVYNNIFDGVSNQAGSVRSVIGAWTTTPSAVSPAVTPVVNVYNNTFYDSGGSRSIYFIMYYAQINSKNNVYYSIGDSFVNMGDPPSQFLSENDIFYGAAVPTTSSRVQITNPLTADPGFVNAAGSDFQLQASSPAIDAGVSTVSSLVTIDYYDNPRPMDGDGNSVASYDIGAHEYNGTYVAPADTTAPVVSNVQATNIGGTSATITWTTNEASTTQVEYGLSSAYGSTTTLDSTLTTTHTVNLTGLSAGTVYNYRVKSKDSAANEAVSSNATFTTSNSAPSVGSFTASAQGGTASLQVVFSATASDPDGYIAKYEWDFDGDGIYDSDTGATGSAIHVYDSAGTYNAKVRVTDNGGATDVSSAIAISVSAASNQPPVVSALNATPQSGYAPLTATFTTNVTDPDGTITKYEWDFDGNGTYELTTTSNPVSFIYVNAGTYTARVRVTDNDGATATGEVNISANNVASSTNGISSVGGSGGGCFIATAAYGSYLDPHVMNLREFRDSYLLTNAPGRLFVKLYYATSPPLADFIQRHETLRTVTRVMLTPLVFGVEYPMASGVLLITILSATVVYRKRRKGKGRA